MPWNSLDEYYGLAMKYKLFGMELKQQIEKEFKDMKKLLPRRKK